MAKYNYERGELFMKKRALSLILSLAVMMSFCSIGASASGSGAKYSYTDSVTTTLSKSGSNLTGKVDVQGYMGITTKIEIKQYLEKHFFGSIWLPVDNGSQTTNSYAASYSKNYGTQTSGTYHIYTEVMVYSGSNYETITQTSTEKTI